jgi:hypothetical protein
LIIRTVLAAVVLAGLGAFASACTEDGSALSLQEYFERVSELDNEQREASNDIEDELDGLGEDATVDQVADLFDEQIDVVRDFREGLDDLDPPDQAADAHDEAVESLGAALEQFESFIEDFRGADSIEDAFARLEAVEFDELERSNDACRDLEEIAADNDIEVDFDCE